MVTPLLNIAETELATGFGHSTSVKVDRDRAALSFAISHTYSGNMKASKDGDLYYIQDCAERDRRSEFACDDCDRQWCHCNSKDCECRNNEDIGN